MGGSHSHDHPGHAHAGAETTRRLILALGINFSFLIVELIGGLWTNSLALLSDAGHMLTDVGALGLALGARWLLSRPHSPRRTYGWQRAEILAAFFNALLLWGVVAWVAWEAFNRFSAPQDVLSGPMIIVAFLGLLANAISAWFLHDHHHDDINVKGAYLHLIADALGSVGAVGAGLYIYFGGSTTADPFISLFIAALILWGSMGLMRESIDILMEAVPADVDLQAVQKTLAGIPQVLEVHDLHVWRIGTGLTALTGHLVVENDTDRDLTLLQAKGALRTNHGIEHLTIQVETADLHRFLTAREHLVQLEPRRDPASNVDPSRIEGEES